MIPLYRQQLAAWRASGLDIFVLPTPHEVRGMAFARPASENRNGKISLHITITGSVHSPCWLYVLLHEVAHQALRHTTQWTTIPLWQLEHAASMWALDILRDLQPYAVALCERRTKEHIRPMLQKMINWGIWNHVNRTVAEWAGCELPPEDPYGPADMSGVEF